VCELDAISYSAINLPQNFNFDNGQNILSYSGDFTSGITYAEFYCEITGVSSQSIPSIKEIIVANSAPYFENSDPDQDVFASSTFYFVHSTFTDVDSNDVLISDATL